jgi:hypothetical protein
MAGETPLTMHTTLDSLGFEDTRRARELYRHVQPHHLVPKLSDHTAGPNDGGTVATGLREALEPYVQLASLRCNASRAFIT